MTSITRCYDEQGNLIAVIGIDDYVPGTKTGKRRVGKSLLPLALIEFKSVKGS